MPLALIVIGVVLAVAAYQDNIPATFSQLESDLAGFWKWAAAIVGLGMLQYIPGFKVPARLLLGLVVVVILLKNGSGFFSQLQSGLATFGQAKPSATPAIAEQAALATAASINEIQAVSSSQTGSGSSGGGGGGVGGLDTSSLASDAALLALA